ncbi:MAG TPA: zinc dependent phospholipase C family protein [Gemmatimonadota bacterium]|nr:zinc dependent phospholipase C family protein [Gemmatimonadota bacterium]
MSARRVAMAGTALAALLLLLQPHALLAWGPGMHVYLGLELLRSLDLLPASAAALLSGHALEFLYGNLAADISMAKRYAPADWHPHAWHVGEEMLTAAGDDPALRAGALGYLSHLSADVVAHEAFVPRMLLLTSSTRALGHSYWEHRMDVAVGAQYTRLARSLVTEFDHSRVDALLDSVLASTLFTFRTNRRIFRGMIRLADYQPWQSLFDSVIEASRWDLEQAETAFYRRTSFESCAAYLIRGSESPTAAGDPTGEEALRLSKRLRRQVLLVEGGAGAGTGLQAAADRHFPLDAPQAGLWEVRGGTPSTGDRARGRLLARAAPRQAG